MAMRGLRWLVQIFAFSYISSGFQRNFLNVGRTRSMSFHSHNFNPELRCWFEKCVQILAKAEVFTNEIVPDQYRSCCGNMPGKAQIDFECDIKRSKSIKCLRSIQFTGGGYTVLNIVALPMIDKLHLPILGIDIVLLPGTYVYIIFEIEIIYCLFFKGSSIIAIDFQPLDPDPRIFQTRPYLQLKSLKEAWADTFPDGGKLPPAATKFFSPYGIWSRMPSNISTDVLHSVETVLYEYVQAYADLCRSSDSGILADEYTSSITTRDAMLAEYLDYRIANDPAKNILQAAFGAEWTEYGLRNIFFPRNDSAYISKSS